MTDTTKYLDLISLPLYGERLIEASAGTGKTFTITALYLRLLLGISGNAAFPRLLSVKNILVMTFTEASTAELRGRIRMNIHDLRVACLRQSTDNPLFKRLLDEITDKQLATQLLLLAERRMDEAAIFTIHGFCQRILHLNAFESGMFYEQLLLEDESELRFQACADFWRRCCYSLPRDIAEAIHVLWKSPKVMLSAIDQYLLGELPVFKSLFSASETLEFRHKKIISHIIELKKQWRESLSNIEDIIKNSGVDRKKFNFRNQVKLFERINAWVHEKTCSYQLPDSLKKFSLSFLKRITKPESIVPQHSLFIAIDDLLAEQMKINNMIFAHAITEIRKTIVHEKNHRGKIGFEDILSLLDEALSNEKGEELASAIRARFPVVIIDEFLDTDPKLYRILRRIWYQQPETAMLLIGDPKQAIYAFRGADIFTYIKARSEIKAHYTLDTNWRSAKGMVASVNTLFTQIDTAFMFRDVPFLPVKSADKNSSLHFTWHGKTQPSISFWLMDGEGCSVSDYKTFMALQSALEICNWLKAGAQGEALLWRDNISRPVKASDITVLVRSRLEETLVRDALMILGIPSVYLSHCDSVFNTLEAQEILWLLRAILSPERDNILRCALASYMFGLTTLDIDFLNNNDSAWNAIVEEFTSYRENWQKYGIMTMLYNLIMRRQIAENMLATPGGLRRLTNLLHIIELLQEASAKLQCKLALVRWLAKHIAEPSSNLSNYQMRLESDEHPVLIVTIHKSKGLEYPLVWLPFIASYRTQKQAFYHDRVSLKSVLDLDLDEESLNLAENERLAEDVRLLYVALTRSVWHCSLGLAPLFQHLGKKGGNTDFHRSAIGRLILKGEPKDASGLRLAVENLCSEHITLHIPNLSNNSHWELKLEKPIFPLLEAREVHRKIVDNWRITSYSEIQKYRQSVIPDHPLPDSDINSVVIIDPILESALTPHQFPRGISTGKFLHSLFEDLDFTLPITEDWLMLMLQKGGYEPHWLPVLRSWIATILKAKLTDSRMSLSLLSAKEKLTEMEFYFPISGLLQARALDSLVREYDPISRICPPLDFCKIRGMLRGFIDLVFRHNNRYYLLDYKSNWLGKSSKSYTQEAMVSAMCSCRYDLQYQLYTLALHRYLHHRITDYHYDTHFGGIIYLFLRGVDIQNTSSGVFTARPVKMLIESIDKLFSTSTQEM